jgi:hypothetical protein
MAAYGAYSLPVTPGTEQKIIRDLLNSVALGLVTQLQNSGGLVISAAGEPTAETANAIRYMINGNLYAKAAVAVLPALVGTVAADKFNVFQFFVNAAGTVRVAMGTVGDTLDAVKFLVYNCIIEVLIGYLIVNFMGIGDFVGGMIDLDDVIVVLNVVYVNIVGLWGLEGLGLA